MPASTKQTAKAGRKQANKELQKYIERSREGARRVATDPDVLQKLGKPKKGKRLTRKQFAKRFPSA